MIFKVINLEEGLPTVEQARQKLLHELQLAQGSGVKGVKLIHGYGSTGVGGDIRLAIGRTLSELQREGQISLVIYGEDWTVGNRSTWDLLKRKPSLKADPDLGRRNRGITIVWF